MDFFDADIHNQETQLQALLPSLTPPAERPRKPVRKLGNWDLAYIFIVSLLSYKGDIHTLTFPDIASQHAAFQSELCTFLRFRWCPVNQI